MLKGVIRALSPMRKKRSSTSSTGSLEDMTGSEELMPENKKFDLTILGATGFTGRLCAKYIANNYADVIPKFKWAIAGRSEERLQSVLAELECRNLPVLVVVDTEQFDTVYAMCQETFVVLNTAGPFEKYSTPVVEACSELGTNYCDITGEVHWCMEMESRYGQAAKNNGALIVHMCGYDSVPSDIGTLMVASHMKQKMGKQCGNVKVFHHGIRGAASGGTLATMLGVAAKPWAKLLEFFWTVVLDPYCYTPKESQRERGRDSGMGQVAVWFDLDMMRLTSPFVFAEMNSRVVRRSASVLGYGDHFRYDEVYAADWTIFDLLLCIGNVLVPILMAIFICFPPSRWLVNKVLLPPGKGPSKSVIENGKFTVTVVGRTSPDKDEGGGAMVVGTVVGTSDPGYGETSKMVCECALAIALQKHELPGRHGGFHTPASGLGILMVDRLRKAGMTLTVDEA